MLIEMAGDTYKYAQNKCKKLLITRQNSSSSSYNTSSRSKVATIVPSRKEVFNFIDCLLGKFFIFSLDFFFNIY